jgi:ribonuclease HII
LSKSDIIRTKTIYEFDSSLRSSNSGCEIICGVDEAGRGPIAGPVVAAAVIFSDDVFIEGVFDSKKISANKREELFEKIISYATCWAVGICDNVTIDKLNILNAAKNAMNEAIEKLNPKPELIIADGNFFSHNTIPVKNIIKADQKSFSVAAASIIAKVTRDKIMSDFENKYPQYSFSSHKGYGTKEHIEEIIEHGYCEIHRKSFKIKAIQGELF